MYIIPISRSISSVTLMLVEHQSSLITYRVTRSFKFEASRFLTLDNWQCEGKGIEMFVVLSNVFSRTAVIGLQFQRRNGGPNRIIACRYAFSYSTISYKILW